MRSCYVLWISCVPDKYLRYCDLFHCGSKLGNQKVAGVEISIIKPRVSWCPLVATDSLFLTVVLCLPSSALQNAHMPLLQEKQVGIMGMLINIYYY